MKVLKRISIGLGIFILLLIAAMIILPIIYEDQIKQVVKKEINNNVNANVNFSDFSITLFRNFPHFTFVLNDLSVINKAPFKGDTLTAVKDFGIAVNLSSVVGYLQNGSQLKIRSIELNNPRINIKVLEDGTASWDIAKKEDETKKKKKKKSSSGESSFNIGLKSFEINHANIVYDDESMGFYLALKDFSHELSGDFTQDQFTMNTYTLADQVTMAHGGVNYLNKVEMEIDADLDMNMKKAKYTFKDNSLRLNALVLGLDGSIAMPEKAPMQTDLRFEAKETAFKHILSLVPAVYAKSFDDIKTKGKMAVNGFAKGAYEEEQYPAFGLNIKVEDAMFKYPDLPTAVNNIQINTQINNRDGVPDHTVVDISKFHVELGKEPFDMQLLLEHPVSNPSIDAQLKGKIDLARLNKIIPLEEGTKLKGIINSDVIAKGQYSAIESGRYHDFTAKGKVNISNLTYHTADYPGMQINNMELEFQPAYLALNTFQGKLGASDVGASGRFSNYLGYYLKDEALTGTFNLHSNYFNVNEWMTEETGGEEEKQETAPEKAPAPEDTVSMTAFEVPKNINFTLTSRFNKLIYDNVELKNVKGKIMIKDQRVTLSNLQMNTLDGLMALSGYYDSKNIDQPKIDFKVNVERMDIQKSYATLNTVKKLAPVAKHASGNYSLIMRIDGALDKHMNPVYKSLNGKGKLILQHVTVKNYTPLANMADKLQMQEYKQFVIKDARPSFKIQNGKIQVDPFDVKIQDTKMNISGHNTLDQKVDYLVKMQVPREKLGGQANQYISGLVNQAKKAGLNVKMGDKINLDVNIKGPYQKPDVKISYAGTSGEQKSMKEQAEEKAKEELEKKKEEAKEKAKEEMEKKKKEAKEKAEKEAEKAKKKAEEEAEKKKKEAEEKAKEKFKDISPF